jgi:beta-galactosidase
MINRCLGSGANGIGYYMYHGGSTPRGDRFYFSDEAYGLPKISYDFQAPIGEFGQVREGFHRLKLLHFFVQNFGDLLAPMSTVLPNDASGLRPENITSLRYAARSKGSSGFLFLNNFQDDTVMTDKTTLQITIKTVSGDITVPRVGDFTLKHDENVIFPFNFNLNGTNLIYATAQLLLKGGDKKNPYYVFFAPEGIAPEFYFSSKETTIKTSAGSIFKKTGNNSLVKCPEGISEFSIINKDGLKTNVLVLPKSLALKAYEIRLRDKKYILFSDAVVLENESSSYTLLSDGKNIYSLSVYPKITELPTIDHGILTKEKSELFSSFTITLQALNLPTEVKSIGQQKHAIKLPVMNDQLNDIFLTVDYTGDTGMGFIDGELVTDEFYKGIPWQIGLRKFISKPLTPKEMVFYFRPMPKDATYLIDLNPTAVPDFGKQKNYLKVKGWFYTPQYRTLLSFKAN